ncbi:hypothetical protein PIB30_062436, partial [Stylosanthes scabra]|nr:hypothetical protein [Stylosanthes scabra]
VVEVVPQPSRELDFVDQSSRHVPKQAGLLRCSLNGLGLHHITWAGMNIRPCSPQVGTLALRCVEVGIHRATKCGSRMLLSYYVDDFSNKSDSRQVFQMGWVETCLISRIETCVTSRVKSSLAGDLFSKWADPEDLGELGRYEQCPYLRLSCNGELKH